MIRENRAGAGPTWIGVQKGWQLRSTDPLPFLIGIGPEELRTHALLIGSTGSGKTTLLHHLIAQDLMRGHSVAVFDLRGDLVEAVLRFCSGQVHPSRVKVLDLREKERPLGFDPLSGPGEPYFRALGVLDAIASESESWGVQLAESLRYALMLLAEVGARLTDVERLFHDRSFRMACVAQAEPSPVTEFWLRFDEELSPDRQQALAMPVLNKVSLLFATKSLRMVLGHPQPLDLSAQVNAGGSVTLASLAVDELHSAGRMVGNLFLAAFTREALSRVHVPEASRNPVRLYVDEFEHFQLSDFETILAEGRRFGLSLVLAHQTLAQLTPKLRSLILGNVGVKFAFRCGREDAATLSKDITGDPKLVNLHDLATGEALVWVRGHGLDLVEINEPILRPSEAIDAGTRQYLESIRALNGEPSPQGTVRTDEVRSGLPQQRTRSGAAAPVGTSLEDWLCN